MTHRNGEDSEEDRSSQLSFEPEEPELKALKAKIVGKHSSKGFTIRIPAHAESDKRKRSDSDSDLDVEGDPCTPRNDGSRKPPKKLRKRKETKRTPKINEHSTTVGSKAGELEKGSLAVVHARKPGHPRKSSVVKSKPHPKPHPKDYSMFPLCAACVFWMPTQQARLQLEHPLRCNINGTVTFIYYLELLHIIPPFRRCDSELSYTI